jgi:hypothetical protein
MSTTYEKADGSRLYVRKTDPLTVEQKAALAAQVQFRERGPAPIKLPRLEFLERELPGERRWSREAIPLKVIE